MKKILLLTIVAGMFYSSYAQYKLISVPDHLQNKKVEVLKPSPSLVGNGTIESKIGLKLDESIVGETIYDLQTYGSMHKRIYAYPDGTIGTIWAMGLDAPDWTTRGTGYNFYDGSSWDPFPTERIETVRTGFPCYVSFGVNGEIAVSHFNDGPLYSFVFNKRDEKGTGVWEEFYLSGPDGVSIVWPELMTSGIDNTTIHVLARTYNGIYMGQDGALLYYRSPDGGDTWDIEHYFFEELGPDYFINIEAESYSWAQPRGETIAFSIGFTHQNGYVMKSYDNGDTWEQILVYENPFTPYAGGETPTFGGGDGSHAIALDSDGKTHVAFGRMCYVYDESNSLLYYPATEGLIYWNETMDVLDTGIISSYTLDYLIEDGYLLGWAIPSEGDSTIIGFGSYAASLTSFPQINIDNNDKVFAIWSGVAPGFTNGTMNFRHICGRASVDGGSTWEPINDFNVSILYWFSECAYPRMSPYFTGNNIHFAFQSDPEPGIHVWLNGHPPVENEIVYMKHPLSTLTGIDNQVPISSLNFSLSQNYPNPFNDRTFVITTLEKDSYISMKILNVVGQEVRYVNFGLVNKGTFRFGIEKKNLTGGIYYYILSDGQQSLTRKMIIQ